MARLSKLVLALLFTILSGWSLPLLSATEMDAGDNASPSARVTEETAVADTPEVGTVTGATATGEVLSPEAGSTAEIVPAAQTLENITPESAVTPSVIEESVAPAETPGGAPATESPGQDGLDTVVPTAVIVIDENAPMSAGDKLKEPDETGPAQSVSVAANPLKLMNMAFFSGASLMNFGYTEFDTNDAWLDEENGVLPGLFLGGTLYWPNWYVSLALNYHFGEVEYQGQTQSTDPALSGMPISSRSDTDIFDTTAIAGYQFSAVTVYGGLGYYFWRRNIQPTMTDNGLPVAGLLEFYSWTYAILGLNTPLTRDEDFHLNLDVRATRMLQANMEVNFLGFGNYDNANLNLGEDWGLRLALPWTFSAFNKDSTITVEPYYTAWNLNRSNVTELTIDGTGTGSGVVEPRSETRNYGVLVYVRFLM